MIWIFHHKKSIILFCSVLLLNCLNHCPFLKEGGKSDSSWARVGQRISRWQENFSWMFWNSDSQMQGASWVKIVFCETRWLITHPKEVCIPIRLVHLLATTSLNKAAFYWLMLKPTFSWAYRYKKTVFTRPISSSGYICSCHHCLCLNLNSHLNLYYRQCLHMQKMHLLKS